MMGCMGSGDIETVVYICRYTSGSYLRPHKQYCWLFMFKDIIGDCQKVSTVWAQQFCHITGKFRLLDFFSQIGELTPHWYNTNDCLYFKASLWIFKSFSSILGFVDPSLQMAYQNTPAPQLKEDKELSRGTQCQAQKYSAWGQITQIRAFTRGTYTKVWWQHVVVVVETGQRLHRALGRLRSDRLSGGWTVPQSLKRATHLDELPALGIKHN